MREEQKRFRFELNFFFQLYMFPALAVCMHPHLDHKDGHSGLWAWMKTYIALT